LRDLGYRPGPVDGSYGAATASAVLAFQKREGLSRDGRAGPQTLGRLDAPQGAGPRSASGPAIEVDLRRQIAFVMDGSGSVTTLNVSTGNGERYTRPPEAGGGTGVANTPVGSYSVQRRIEGWRDGPLGLMYQPMYFKGGFAVHGSHSVPAYPASHGCVRVSIADSEWVWDVIPNRARVTLYR
jgi:lipoprotein-anchoring transpeptidase ErfK/SrfK